MVIIPSAGHGYLNPVTLVRETKWKRKANEHVLFMQRNYGNQEREKRNKTKW